MGNDNSNLNIEKMNKIFVDKFADYLDLMRVADCTEEELTTKSGCLIEYNKLSAEDRARIVKDDMSFLDFFTSGGIVCSDDDGRKLYTGINKEIAHSVMCTMSSIKSNVEFPKEYTDELNSTDTLPRIKDMVSKDMSILFPDMKKLFFLGKNEEFNSRMLKVFKDTSDLEQFSDIVDSSVIHNNESGFYQYTDLIESAIISSKDINFEEKSVNLS